MSFPASTADTSQEEIEHDDILSQKQTANRDSYKSPRILTVAPDHTASTFYLTGATRDQGVMAIGVIGGMKSFKFEQILCSHLTR